MNILIRKMKLEDIDSIINIERSISSINHWSKETYINEIENKYSRYFIYELDISHEIIGYIGYWIINDEGHIITLAVSPFYRNKGVADKLLYTLIKDAISKSVKWLTLEVRISNAPAINLYNKYKFKQLGIRKKYYQDNGEDALILWSENLQDDFYMNMKNPFLSIIIENTTADKL
ncbi:MAG: ribosomal-protein-alanine N-acetyltransferase [Candidatus Melainabacteria bacterium RIFCSPHIGHO2_02_FULL_34_12]|nr:MAG: ribosomal-protein-alanine N-acetyltransferase [Candidatus Melainabacteria bacterium RIFCSPHIGHO2_02_FULL_34_12]